MKDIINIFTKNEIKKVWKNSRSQIILLCLMFGLLILALNQSIFGLAQINEKYTNPFVNYIQVATPIFSEDRDQTIKDIITTFNKSDIKSKLKIESLSEIHYDYITFTNPESGKVKTYKGRTFQVNDDLYNEIVKKEENIIIKRNLSDNNINKQYGIIVTEALVKELGYDPESIQFLPLKLEERNFVLLPINTVVKNLPQFSDFMISEDFSHINNESIDKTNFANFGPSNQTTILTFNDTLGLIKQAKSEIGKVQSSKCRPITIDKSNTAYACSFSTEDYKDLYEKADIIRDLNNKKNKESYRYSFYSLDYVDVDKSQKFAADYLEFKFASLDSIKVFQQYCLQNNLEPDMQIINSRQIFSEVGTISRVLAIGFILYSIFMLYIFTESFISKHISEIRPILGTLVAFGMSSAIIKKVYLRVILYYT